MMIARIFILDVAKGTGDVLRPWLHSMSMVTRLEGSLI
jgi:hypothetical protein